MEFLDARIAGAGQPDVKPAAGQPGRINVSVEALGVALRVLNLQVAKGGLPSDLASQVTPLKQLLRAPNQWQCARNGCAF